MAMADASIADAQERRPMNDPSGSNDPND